MRRIVTFLTLLLMYSVNAQNDNCKSEILAFNKKMSQLSKPANGAVYAFEYIQEISYWDASTSSSKVHARYYIGENQLHVLSDKMKVYSDENFIYTVLEDEKQVIITQNVQNEASKQTISTFFKSQEIILKKCSVKSCTEDKSKGLKKIIVDASKTDIDGIELNEVTYFMNTKTGDLKKAIVTYTRDYPIRRMTMEIVKTDFKSSYSFPKDLKSQFLDSQGKLKAKYKGYQLIN